MNVNKLKGKIVEKGLTIGKLASMIGINRSTLYRKLNASTLTVKEVNLIVKALELSREEAIDIFFTHKVA
jgi:predicted transcriptional regulator